jgi:L-histidine Nalpha-methyltransferase
METQSSTYHQAVADAVLKGLASEPKSLPSWLFYDETGDRLFQEIMRMPEYYPTRCEYDILQQHKDALKKHFTERARTFKLIELGAGDGIKTEILLKHFMSQGIDFTYLPVDISPHVLDTLKKRLSAAVPGLKINAINKTYHEALKDLRSLDERKIILFLGANIGNFTLHEATIFLSRLVIPLTAKDMLLIGFDLKKDPRIIQEAYDDPRGLTREFNLNILTRINRELGSDFAPAEFTHFPYYDPESGATKSFLMSMKDQAVRIPSLDRIIHFEQWETIQTEVSQKYDIRMIEKLVALSGLRIADIFYDNQKYFCDVLVKPA